MLCKVQLLKGEVDWDLSDEETAEDYYHLEAAALRNEDVQVLDVEVDMGDAQSSYYKVQIVPTRQVIMALGATHLMVETPALAAFYRAHKS